MAFVEEIHLRAKGRAGFFVVKIGEEGIVVVLEHAARVQLLGEDARQRRFAHADRPFDRDVPWRLERRLPPAPCSGLAARVARIVRAEN